MRDVVHRGVRLVSRYRKGSEFTQMAAMVNFLAGQTDRQPAELIAEIFCDSQAGATFTVRARDGAIDADALAGDCERGLQLTAPGHNGIGVEGPDGQLLASRDPWWSDDVQDMARH